MFGDQGDAQAQLDGRDRCANEPVLLSRQLAYIRSDNGLEFIAEAIRQWIKAVSAETAYIEPGSLWENMYYEIVLAKFRDELLNGEIFYCLKEAQILIDPWRRYYNYNTELPDSALGYRPQAP